MAKKQPKAKPVTGSIRICTRISTTRGRRVVPCSQLFIFEDAQGLETAIRQARTECASRGLRNCVLVEYTVGGSKRREIPVEAADHSDPEADKPLRLHRRTYLEDHGFLEVSLVGQSLRIRIAMGDGYGDTLGTLESSLSFGQCWIGPANSAGQSALHLSGGWVYVSGDEAEQLLERFGPLGLQDKRLSSPSAPAPKAADLPTTLASSEPVASEPFSDDLDDLVPRRDLPLEPAGEVRS